MVRFRIQLKRSSRFNVCFAEFPESVSVLENLRDLSLVQTTYSGGFCLDSSAVFCTTSLSAHPLPVLFYKLEDGQFK
jgi:hypothetical protein